MANLETKGNLARLLAQENLVVEHRSTFTASFNVENRVLTLPLWEEASETVYDLLVGHEVGHALYTPCDFIIDDVPKDIVNVVEDARIEKLIKRRYPGLARDFFEGYKELNEKDFFHIKDKDLSKFNLIDRINLHYKCGADTFVPFDDDEKQFISRIDKAETFDDVKVICQEIYKFVNEKIVFPSEFEHNRESMGSDPELAEELAEQLADLTKAFVENLEDGEGESNEGEGESDEGEGVESRSSGGSFYDSDCESETQAALDENIKSLVNTNSYANHNDYVEIGKTHLDKVIAPFDKLHGYLEQWSEEIGLGYFQVVDESFREFKQSARSEVNYLVKEFEMKKSADVYSRALQSKTGVLDDRKLYSYRYTEDIFKRVTVLPEGKNHGMIFILDWSGSMGNVIQSTVKQLINLCWFCKKVGIPFEVYAFTYEWHPSLIDTELDWDLGEKGLDEDGKMCVHKKFSLLNFVSSSARSKDFEKSLLNLYRLAASHNGFAGASYRTPLGVDLSGTPLDDTILALHDIIPEFIKKTKSQKTTVCILTDGESAQSSYRSPKSCYRYKRYFDVHTILRDRKLGKTYRMGYWDSSSTIMLRHLNDKFPDVNLVGFRIASGSDFSTAYHSHHGIRWTPDDVKKKWSRDKCWEFNNCGYDSLYYIANSNMESSTEVNVDDHASKAQITKAFKNMLKSKKTNKKIMSSFASVVS